MPGAWAAADFPADAEAFMGLKEAASEGSRLSMASGVSAGRTKWLSQCGQYSSTSSNSLQKMKSMVKRGPIRKGTREKEKEA